MRDEKNVMELLEELKNAPELSPDHKARDVLVEKLIFAMIED